jgi:mersacidin/lichenicidin family type 2 lantibiotic
MIPIRPAARRDTVKKIDIARAWRDEDYYLSLTADERASLPENPAAGVTVTRDSLRAVNGGVTTIYDSCNGTAICTPCPPQDCD